jgi:hypothetical protein
VKFFKETAVG